MYRGYTSMYLSAYVSLPTNSLALNLVFFYLLTHWITDCLSIYLDYPCTSVLFLEFVSEPADGRASIYLLLRGWQVDVFRQAFALSSAHCSVRRVWKWYGSCLSVVAIMVVVCLLGRPSAYCSIHLSSCQDSKTPIRRHVAALVSISRRKGGRRMSLRRTFGLVTCPLLFFTLPSSFHSSLWFFWRLWMW